MHYQINSDFVVKRSPGLGTRPASALQPRLTGDLLIKNVQCVQKLNEFKSSLPLHFDMLNATPYSLSKEGISNLGSINRVKRSLNVQITIEKL
jgi:hypothetical protein